jgi:phosphonate transport system substrate-binding protein
MRRILTPAISAAVLAVAVAVLLWLGSRPTGPGVANQGLDSNPDAAPAPGAALAETPLRLGLVPERDIFAQHRRYRALADWLEPRLRRRVELATLNTYQGVLADLAEQRVEGAFVGSLLAVLARDRHGVRLVAKPETEDGITTYQGVLFVTAASPVTRVEQLAGRPVAMVRATTAGDLFPIHLFDRHGLLDGANPPAIRWVGTHDQVVEAVLAGRVDAGAAKDLRLEASLAQRPGAQIRRLAVSEPVPTNALVLRSDVAPVFAEALKQALLAMHEQPAGQAALKAFGARRFVPCDPAEYRAIYEMVEALGPQWPKLEIEGPPPTLAAHRSDPATPTSPPQPRDNP